MGIQTIHGEYLIIKKIYNNDLFEINLCKYEEAEEDILYTVITLKDQELVHNTIQLFSSLRQNHKFVDFIECFSKNSYLYVVFSYYKEVPLNIEEVKNIPLMQRVDIVKQILSQVVILDMPKLILYDVLSKENINLDSSGKVYFNYFLKRVDGYNNLKVEYYVKRIGIIITNIFSEELQNKSVKGLNEFADKCNNGQYKNQMDIYSDYNELYNSFVKSLSIVKEKKISWFRRLFNKILAIFNMLKPFLIMVALCAGVVYLIVTLTNNTKNQDPTKIEHIGNVQIDE